MQLIWLHKGQSLKTSLGNRDRNNFNGIRLVSALLVILGHSYGFLDNRADPVDALTGKTLSANDAGLSIFFFLSGLLITQSLANSPSRKNFVWKRVLRIYPAACLAILSAAIIIGPLVTHFSRLDYFSNPLFFRYLGSCSLVQIYYELPGVFEHSPMGRSINASLWSLSLECKLYACVLLSSFIGSTALKKGLLLAITLTGIGCSIFFYEQTEVFFRRYAGNNFMAGPYLRVSPFFFIGMLCFYYREKIFISHYWLTALAACCISAAFVRLPGPAFFILIPALTLYAGTNASAFLRRLTPRADLSYGLYVFGYPVQQLVTNYLHPVDSFTLFLISTFLLVPLALASWLLVEKRLLRYKGLVG